MINMFKDPVDSKNDDAYRKYRDETDRMMLGIDKNPIGSTENYHKIINTDVCPFNSLRVKENCQHFSGGICEMENCKFYVPE